MMTSLLFIAVEVFLKSGLKKGDDISEDRFSLLIEQNKLFHIKQRAFRLPGRRQHSSFELRRKLWNKDYEQKLIDEVIEDLRKSGYLRRLQEAYLAKRPSVWKRIEIIERYLDPGPGRDS